jgi:2-polyprenyl-6-methoxyphenol hydroxylase-like FAD-dependent oxidoreductase
VERGTELVGFEELEGRVEARLRRSDGAEEVCDAAYVAGCDGAHSAVRRTLGMGFEGGTYTHLFYVADVQASGAVVNGEIHVAFDRTDFLAVFPLKDEGRVRLVGTVRDEAEDAQDELKWEDVSGRVLEWIGIDVERVNWFSTYRVHHRVASGFRKGRAFLLGDAAHIHSPVGGQGMNTGIGDAVNLAWKLAAAVEGRGKEALLDTYEPERIAFARRLVATTDQAFIAVTSPGLLARFVRLEFVPAVLPRLLAFRAVRRLLFRTVSQIGVNYRRSALSAGRAGRVRGGDRLPWVGENFEALKSMAWPVHVYGEASAELKGMCAERAIELHEFRWRREMRGAGLRRGVAYVVRPDGYVGMVEARGKIEVVRGYLEAWGIG